VGKTLFRETLDWCERHYLEALAIDSGLTIARWRLAEVRRWLAHRPIEVDLSELSRTASGDLGSLDSLLLDTRVQPYGPEQFRRYEAILANDAYRNDAYTTLLYADELYHRGGLWGVPLDSAVSLLELAVARDSFLAPAVEHLTQALIRKGRKAEAARMLAHLRKISAPPEEVIVYYPAIWRQAYLERFEPQRAEAGLDQLLSSPGVDPVAILALGARWIRYIDQPATQVVTGKRLVEAAPHDAILTAAGHLAQGLGLISQAHIRAALAQFDTVAIVSGAPAARVQAAEWRVVPYALDLEGFSTGEAGSGAGELTALYADTMLAPVLRARSAWAVAAFALHEDDRAALERWSARLDSIGPAADADRLRRLLGAMRLAAAGEYDGALRMTEADLAYDSVGLGRRPFVRAALYFQRGMWKYAKGDLQGAIASWLWHENTDLEDLSPLLVQAAEVDGAFGAWARVRIVRAASQLGGDRHLMICENAADVRRLWQDPDPELAPLADEMRRALAEEKCPS
jgi:hypothetical protein